MFIAAGGWLATMFNVREAVLISGILCLGSGAFLPWRDVQVDGTDGNLGGALEN